MTRSLLVAALLVLATGPTTAIADDAGPDWPRTIAVRADSPAP